MEHMSDKKSMVWDRESANEFTLWSGDDLLCCIMRSYPQRLCASGFSYEVNDTTKPMEWCIVRPGQPTRRLGTPGMNVRKAKAQALDLLGLL